MNGTTGGRPNKTNTERGPLMPDSSNKRFLKGEGEFEGEGETFFRWKKFPPPPQKIRSPPTRQCRHQAAACRDWRSSDRARGDRHSRRSRSADGRGRGREIPA